MKAFFIILLSKKYLIYLEEIKNIKYVRKRIKGKSTTISYSK